MDKVALGAALLAAREAANIKRSDAASALGISYNALWRIEQGQRWGSVPLVIRAARLYRLNPLTLLGQEEEEVS